MNGSIMSSQSPVMELAAPSWHKNSPLVAIHVQPESIIPYRSELANGITLRRQRNLYILRCVMNIFESQNISDLICNIQYYSARQNHVANDHVSGNTLLFLATIIFYQTFCISRLERPNSLDICMMQYNTKERLAVIFKMTTTKQKN